ncbi:related to conserved hypothetical Ustilaginaceae-specific protein [Ustilago trichophora]|uniref:Related to conserved hypothetical Ustilaginaceae-specific protein n=1 Tax=Ustilago trichophora TaxID=86804 RepID=A0A5C3EFT8_9BASI|nr:related to conserved hypothetical Ustilaginaceae-specific protein [Ustilago trichophora]
MKVLLNLVALSTAIAGVFALGGISGSDVAGPSEPAPAAEPFQDHYFIETYAPVQHHQFAGSLSHHLKKEWEINDLQIRTNAQSSLSENNLQKILNYDRRARRFLYLGSSYRNIPDLVLATPVDVKGRSHLWALLQAQQPYIATDGRGHVISHGFVTVSPGEPALVKLAKYGKPHNGELKSGHVLSIEEVFGHLAALKPPV